MAKHKVLVVDDSALMRRLLVQILQAEGYEVVIARHGEEAVEMLLSEQPDVVTLDINMPKMDGLTALSLMMAARPTPVIMVSSLTESGALATLEAMALGAVDYVLKPGGTISLSIEEVAKSLLQKIKAAALSRPKVALKVSHKVGKPTTQSLPLTASTRMSATGHLENAGMSVVLIGVSTGGPRTLEDILPLLPADFPAAVLVAQHMPANFTAAFAQRLGRMCEMQVREVNAVMPLQAGHIYIGQGGTDMVLSKRLGRIVVAPAAESAAHPWHPSVDRMVETAMKVLPSHQLIGVQLTGMGYDGAPSMTALKEQGGKTIAESQDSAVVFGMPYELIQRGGASVVLPAHSVAQQLRNWVTR